MIVQWNQPNMITGYAPTSKHGTNVEQKFTLLPGNNEIPDDQWEEVKKHPLLKHYMSDKSLVEMTKPEKDNKKSREGLAQYDMPQSLEIIKGTFDKVLLAKWQGIETREGVQSAIKKQLDMIEEKTKKDQPTESDDE